MKWSELFKTVNEDQSDSDSDNSETPHEPVISYENVPHRGGVNRLRTMHGSPIVATWNEEAEIGIYNIAAAVDELD